MFLPNVFLLTILCNFLKIKCENELSKSVADLSVAVLKQGSANDRNAFFSPASISAAMAMTRAGANGQTKDQIGSVIFGGLSEDTVKTQAKSLETQLKQLPNETYKISCASRAYLSNTTKVLDTYKQTLVDDFDSDIISMDFVQSEKSRSTINRWVEETTYNKINNLLPRGFITIDTKFVLVNAIYFKSDWNKQFKKADTKELEFTKLDQSKVNISMMYRQFGKDIFLKRQPEVTVLGLPYKGDSIVMYFILPNTRSGLREVERGMDGQKLYDLINNVPRRRRPKRLLEVYVPKFKLEVEMNLKIVLKKLNVTDMFDNADLSGITGDRSLSVTGVIHKAVVEVNEEGSEAAAATAVGGGSRSGRPDPPEPPFIADHPFLFAIVHQPTKFILFFGRFTG